MKNIISNYIKNGYVEIKNVFTKADAHSFAVTLLYLIKAQNCKKLSVPRNLESKSLSYLKSKINECLIILENTNHKYIRKVYDSIRNTPIIDNLTLKPKIISIIKKLMNLSNNSPLYITQKACRIDIPNNNTFSLDWHQEAQYTIKETELVQLWAPILEDVKRINGALKVLPRSHKQEFLRQMITYPRLVTLNMFQRKNIFLNFLKPLLKWITEMFYYFQKH